MAGIRYVTPPQEHEPRLIEGKNGESFYIKVRGGLSTKESQIASTLLEEDEDAFDMAAELSRTISMAEGLTHVEAYQIIERAVARKKVEMEGDEKERGEKEYGIRLRYSREIKAVRLAWKNAGQRGTEATVTAMIQCRVEVDGRWTIEDTRNLGADVYQQIVELMNEEQSTAKKVAEPPSEDELKKQQQEADQNPESTGPQSSTNSQKPTPAATKEKPSQTK